MIFNHEQLSIIYSQEKILLVNALAGTGKTTTLIEYAEHRFSESILYLVFNSNLRKESKNKFPINTEVHTINSFVYQHMKSIIKNRNIIDGLSISFIRKKFPLLKNNYSKAVSVSDSFNLILNSSINIVSDSFLEIEEHKLAYELILLMRNDISFPITHSFIMHEFLLNFDFSYFSFDHILVDEAQDISLPMLNIINKLNSKSTVFVGDFKQSIYGFRNSLNIFNLVEFKEAKKMKLTYSYRFGKEISSTISSLTNLAYHEKIEIHGMSENNGIVLSSSKDFIPQSYHAYISRTNSHLFDMAFSAAESGKKVSIPFDWDIIKELFSDMFYLKANLTDKITSKVIKQYSSYSEMKNIVSAGGDIELSFLINITEKYGFSLLDNLALLERQLSSPRFSDIIFITAHKAKGLEFYSVEVGGDFRKYALGTELEEKNLIYVAMTRPMEVLILNEDLNNLLKKIML